MGHSQFCISDAKEALIQKKTEDNNNRRRIPSLSSTCCCLVGKYAQFHGDRVGLSSTC